MRVIHHPEASIHGSRRSLAVAAFAVAASAFAGAVGLAGGGLSLGDEVTPRLPFHSPVFGGVALATLVGLPFCVLGWLARRGDHRTDIAAVLVGLALIGWLVVELAFIRTFSFFHPLFALIGAAFIHAGRRSQRRSRAT